MYDSTGKAEEYKKRLSEINTQKQAVEKQVIILEEQFNQYKEKVEQAFNTSDITELEKIALGYQQDIEILEKQLQDVQNATN